MEVLLISRYIFLGPHGTAKSAYYILEGMKKKKIKIRAIHLKNPTHRAVKDTIKMLILGKRLFKKYKRGNYVCYFHDPHDTLPLLPFLLKFPSIVCIHDLIPLIIKERKFLHDLYYKLCLLVIRSLMKHRKIIITSPSLATKHDLIKFGFPKERIAIVRWGVDHNIYKPIAEIQKEKKRRKEILIGFLGALVKKGGRKRVDILIDAIKKLKLKYKNIKLLLGGKYADWVIRKLKDVGTYLGILPEDEVPKFYNRVDIFVYPSEYEGFGMQILEAMSCRTLILASDIYAFRELLPKELLFKLNDEELVRKIEKFLDKKVIERYSDILHKESLKYSWENTLHKLIKLIKLLSP